MIDGKHTSSSAFWQLGYLGTLSRPTATYIQSFRRALPFCGIHRPLEILTQIAIFSTTTVRYKMRHSDTSSFSLRRITRIRGRHSRSRRANYHLIIQHPLDNPSSTCSFNVHSFIMEKSVLWRLCEKNTESRALVILPLRTAWHVHTKRGLLKIPPELRLVIFKYCEMMSPPGDITPNYLIAMRVHSLLYNEALDVYYKTRFFSLEPINASKFQGAHIFKASPRGTEILVEPRLPDVDIHHVESMRFLSVWAM